MKKSELRRLVKEEMKKILNETIKTGDVVRVNPKKLKIWANKQGFAGPHLLKLVNKELKYGHGKVIVGNIIGDEAEIYATPVSRLLGGALEVPLDILEKV